MSRRRLVLSYPLAHLPAEAVPPVLRRMDTLSAEELREEGTVFFQIGICGRR